MTGLKLVQLPATVDRLSVLLILSYVTGSLCITVQKNRGDGWAGYIKSEEYLDDIINLPSSPLSKHIILAHQCSTGGFICGEI